MTTAEEQEFLQSAYSRPDVTYKAYLATLRIPDARSKTEFILAVSPDAFIAKIVNDDLIPQVLRTAIGYALRWKANQLQKAMTAHLN